MLLIPVIDLKRGRCVRLKQGLMEQAAVLSDLPAEITLHWLKQGAHRLHLADLNGAFADIPRNFPATKSVLAEVANDISAQLGGGIRGSATTEKYLDLGLADIIIGTAAVKNPDFVREAYKGFPGQIIVGLDVKDGAVVIDGWTIVAERRVTDLAKRFEEDGVNAIIYTDIDHDGMVSGINIEVTVKLVQVVAVSVITSSDLTNLDSICILCAVEKHGVADVTTGRAVYGGSIDFAEAQKLVDVLNAV